ncbi:terminase small subunit [Exiguobacterium aestuarii]|uniref:terminase small subunit n=1 Tax=Exiguobacterium aestuarii TaxID=273527 RepID=UPI001CD28A91|nr:terminase small subunit [Exiguobacterium aestuarii]MCA0980227.1 terminase small subunit [Exiguobacterium aestuarii]
MNARQQRFCDEYLVDLNATKAAIRAGYSEKYAGQNADKLLKNTKIRNYIDARLNAKERSLIASQDEVLETLTRIIMGDERGTALVGVGMGAQEVSQVPPTNAEKIRAAEILGKYYKLFTDRSEVDVKGSLAVQFVDDIGGDDG